MNLHHWQYEKTGNGIHKGSERFVIKVLWIITFVQMKMIH